MERSETESSSGLKVMDDFTGRETQPYPPFVVLTCLFVCWMEEGEREVKKENVKRAEVGVETESRSGLTMMDDFTGRETQPQPPFDGLTSLFVCWMEEREKE